MRDSRSVLIRQLSPEEWQRLPAGSPYLTKQFVDSASVVEPDLVETVCLEFADSTTGAVAHLPLILRKIQHTSFLDATSPYGYGGFYGDQIEPSAALSALRRWASTRGVIAAFLRMDPVENYWARSPGMVPGLVTLGSTVLWPIEETDKLLSGMKKKHRQYTRKAQNSGLTSGVQVNPTELSHFVALYNESMQRLEAGDYYYFSQDYWSSFASATGPNVLLVDVSLNQQSLCSLLCLIGDSVIHAHLLGTSDIGRELKANYLAYYSAAEWGSKHGYTHMHLGGGFGGGKSDLLDWKTGFCPSAPPRDFNVMKLVLDASAYRKTSGSDSVDGYFPPWRR